MEELTLYIPHRDELGFYRSMLSDPDTMSYNAPWSPPDGCISFPPEKWDPWYSRWIGQEPTRFFAYLQRKSDGQFVGYENFHFTPEQNWWDMGILIRASERGKGYGRQGLSLLLDRAFRVNGIPCLHNLFELSRAAALHIHKQAGFRSNGTENDLVHLLLTKETYEQRLSVSTDTAFNPRWVFFDLGSTLVDESEADLHRIQETIRETNITLEDYLRKRQEFAAFRHAPDQATMQYFELKKAAWPSEYERPYADALPVLLALKQRGFHLGLIANQVPGIRERLKAWGFLALFEVIADSASLGTAKPSPEIFLSALRQAHCPPPEAVMVGDRMDNDITPAKKLGMKTVRILRGVTKNATPQTADEQADLEIHDLTELLECRFLQDAI